MYRLGSSPMWLSTLMSTYSGSSTSNVSFPRTEDWLPTKTNAAKEPFVSSLSCVWWRSVWLDHWWMQFGVGFPKCMVPCELWRFGWRVKGRSTAVAAVGSKVCGACLRGTCEDVWRAKYFWNCNWSYKHSWESLGVLISRFSVKLQGESNISGVNNCFLIKGHFCDLSGHERHPQQQKKTAQSIKGKQS